MHVVPRGGAVEQVVGRTYAPPDAPRPLPPAASAPPTKRRSTSTWLPTGLHSRRSSTARILSGHADELRELARLQLLERVTSLRHNLNDSRRNAMRVHLFNGTQRIEHSSNLDPVFERNLFDHPSGNGSLVRERPFEERNVILQRVCYTRRELVRRRALGKRLELQRKERGIMRRILAGNHSIARAHSLKHAPRNAPVVKFRKGGALFARAFELGVQKRSLGSHSGDNLLVKRVEHLAEVRCALLNFEFIRVSLTDNLVAARAATAEAVTPVAVSATSASGIEATLYVRSERGVVLATIDD